MSEARVETLKKEGSPNFKRNKGLANKGSEQFLWRGRRDPFTASRSLDYEEGYLLRRREMEVIFRLLISRALLQG